MIDGFNKDDFVFGYLLFTNLNHLNQEFELYSYLPENIQPESPMIILYQDLNNPLSYIMINNDDSVTFESLKNNEFLSKIL